MGHFFFDESIHERGGFILGAFVYAPFAITDLVALALHRAGLIPGQHEFKSSARMDRAPELIRVRDDLFRIIHHHTNIAVLVCPVAERTRLDKEALEALCNVIRANGLDGTHHEAYFDEGVVLNRSRAEAFASELQLSPACTFHLKADSRAVPGLQLADLVAHTCSMMLLEQLGVTRKLVKVGPNSGYDPDLEVDLGWDLWTALRYSFFSAGNDCSIEDGPLSLVTVNVSGYGLFVASACDPALRRAAEDRFGKCYLGCIH